MNNQKRILKVILVILIAVFLLIGIAAILLAGYRKREAKEKKKQAAIEQLERVPTVTPTPAVTATPTPVPTATPTPTPVPTVVPAIHTEDFLGTWYSTDGLAAISVYELSEKSVSFFFTQTNTKGSVVCEADVTAEVAGNASSFSFTDSWGNRAGGSMTFDKDGLFVRISTSERVEGVSVCPGVNCVMVREKKAVQQAEPSVVPSPTPAGSGDASEYYFADSDSRYLTDEELSGYSSSDLELAKNEIYARRGRQFVTPRIAEYFNSKSWYQGTIAPETFDAQQDSIFNEYEVANIAKIVQWEEKKRSEGK